ncbi:hypothetical protein D6C98_06501 [Aureobasidium pullulans]|nr:hypothetical protein D6C98_06501 [Aureobasidium pullulans]
MLGIMRFGHSKGRRERAQKERGREHRSHRHKLPQLVESLTLKYIFVRERPASQTLLSRIAASHTNSNFPLIRLHRTTTSINMTTVKHNTTSKKWPYISHFEDALLTIKKRYRIEAANARILRNYRDALNARAIIEAAEYVERITKMAQFK